MIKEKYILILQEDQILCKRRISEKLNVKNYIGRNEIFSSTRSRYNIFVYKIKVGFAIPKCFKIEKIYCNYVLMLKNFNLSKFRKKRIIYHSKLTF